MADAPSYDWTEEERLEDEAVWRSQSDLKRMIYSLARVNDFGIAPISPRKWRLFAVACVRRVAHLFKDERTHGLIRAIEDIADGLIDHAEYRRLEEGVCGPPYQDSVAEGDDSSPLSNASSSLCWASEERVEAYESYWAAYAAQEATGQAEVEVHAQTDLLHELFNNPFKRLPTVLAPLTPLVVALVRTAYDERRFPGGELDCVLLSILADALEEVGAGLELVGHLRSPGPHVRGCWVVDLILSKDR